MTTLTPRQTVLFRKGKEVGKQGQHAYAVELLSQLVKEAPEFTDARRLLRFYEIKKQQTIPSWRRWGQNIFFKLKALLAINQPPFKKMEIAEEILAVNPFHRHGNALLVEAATAMESYEISILAHETLCRAFPHEIAHFKNLGKACLAASHLIAAQAAYEAALLLNPYDSEAIKGMKDACALHATTSSGWSKSLP